MTQFDLLIKGGRVVDPVNHREGTYDVGITGKQIAAVEPELPAADAAQVYPAANKLVLPGLVDTHVHLTPAEDRGIGLQMLARAGVTCALDCSGLVDDLVDAMTRWGSGITVAVLNRLDPGNTISGPDAGAAELHRYLDDSLQAGALGFKLFGGHLPLSPETTAAAIEVCNHNGAYVAFHCGSTKNGGNLKGLLDAFEFAGDHRLHICHVNAYCRGLTHGDPLTECKIALDELARRPHLVSESHMAPFNSCASRLHNGKPRSHVTRTCLARRDYSLSADGLLAALHDGYMRVYANTPQGVQFLNIEEAASHLESRRFDAMVSFPVNLRSCAFLMATEKNEREDFIVTALSTDGGGIPRNYLLSHGLSLVRFDALSLAEFVSKTSVMPARMLGLGSKGHFSPSADADIVVADADTFEAQLTVAGGRIVMQDGNVCGRGGTLLVTDRFAADLPDPIRPRCVDLGESLLYAGS